MSQDVRDATTDQKHGWTPSLGLGDHGSTIKKTVPPLPEVAAPMPLGLPERIKEPRHYIHGYACHVIDSDGYFDYYLDDRYAVIYRVVQTTDENRNNEAWMQKVREIVDLMRSKTEAVQTGNVQIDDEWSSYGWAELNETVHSFTGSP